MHYICNMKTNGNKFNLNERIEQYRINQAQLLYEFASDLLDQVADEDVLELYKDNSDVFSKLSTLSKEEILNDKVLLMKAVNVLINYLENKPLTEEEYDEMTFDEILDYVNELIEDKKVCLFDIIKYLESK